MEKANSGDMANRCLTGSQETVVDWVMLDRAGRTSYFGDPDDVHEALNKGNAAVAVRTARGHSGYISFTLAAPPQVSYLDLHWPNVPAGNKSTLLAYTDVLAADKDLLLLRIHIARQSSFSKVPRDLFVYKAGGPSPSALRLPMHAMIDKGLTLRTRYLVNDHIGILRLAGRRDRYIVSDLIVSGRRTDGDDAIIYANLCVFSSKKGKWRIISKPVPQPLEFPVLWSTDDVLPFDGRFLCWVDYLSGVLLCDFSDISSPALHYAPFPGKLYSDHARVPRCITGRYRSVSVNQGVMRFVHVDNDWYERVEMQNSRHDSDWSERSKWRPRPISGSKITVWTLNMTDGDFKWEVNRVINLDCLWAQQSYQEPCMPRRLLEFPIVAMDDPDVLCCLLREEEFSGKAWMIMVDMRFAYLRSYTPYINEHLIGCEEDLRSDFNEMPLLPTVFSKYLTKPTTGILGDTDQVATRSSEVTTCSSGARSSEVATRSSKRGKLST